MPESPPKPETLHDCITILAALLECLQALDHTHTCPSCGRPLTVTKPGLNVVDVNQVCDACQPVAPITDLPQQQFEP